MKVKKKIQLYLVLVLFAVLGMESLFCSRSIAAINETDLYLKVESYTWKEFDNGEELLEETGPIFGLGFSNRSNIGRWFVLSEKIELFTGTVDYDGETQSGTPATTESGYFGYLLEMNFGGKIVSREKFSLEPFVGLGFRWWKRSLHDANTAYGYVYGYEEEWSSIYTRLGLHTESQVSERFKLFAQAGIKYPIHNRNEAKLSRFGIEDVTLEPKSELSYFADAGFKTGHFMLSFYYEGMRFDESDLDDTYGAILQPESEGDIFGVKIGFAF
ncbi:MAG: hypothetical protein P8X96_19145 [Desulfobacteraceae bacterium]